ncbi:MAG: hypothetical protein GX494_00905 [Clostridiaceae bacterium]|jgi:hypothetical protein|nr:hypothetical protein [Clostridiaceae bacterium]
MKKKNLTAAAVVFIFFAGYYVISNNFSGHSRVNVSEVQSITINSLFFEADNNPEEISDFIRIYNSAKILRKDYDTTPSYLIEIKLKNGKRIGIQGTTQGFHYVNDGEKSYKISSAGMTNYLRNITK